MTLFLENQPLFQADFTDFKRFVGVPTISKSKRQSSRPKVGDPTFSGSDSDLFRENVAVPTILFPKKSELSCENAGVPTNTKFNREFPGSNKNVVHPTFSGKINPP
ncbi:hypothetical protein CH378_20475 [Leptospira kmetyi]|uniref:Uncharacterized protein n=1 Tax=Leptospira kmetyi TaxID=408139 RepID=A0ABX4N3Q6_9LEPT|nr:hypothetical protein CH378_20475 [Leptospira kmetyi]